MLMLDLVMFGAPFLFFLVWGDGVGWAFLWGFCGWVGGRIVLWVRLMAHVERELYRRHYNWYRMQKHERSWHRRRHLELLEYKYEKRKNERGDDE